MSPTLPYLRCLPDDVAFFCAHAAIGSTVALEIDRELPVVALLNRSCTAGSDRESCQSHKKGGSKHRDTVALRVGSIWCVLCVAGNRMRFK